MLIRHPDPESILIHSGTSALSTRAHIAVPLRKRMLLIADVLYKIPSRVCIPSRACASILRILWWRCPIRARSWVLLLHDLLCRPLVLSHLLLRVRVVVHRSLCSWRGAVLLLRQWNLGKWS